MIVFFVFLLLPVISFAAQEAAENHTIADNLTDEVLPRTDPRTVGLFYDLMMKIDTVFQQSNLRYWATCGTLLGVVRHGGMIPWDDDIDIAISAQDISSLKNTRSELAKLGLELYYDPNLKFYKIFYKNGKPTYHKNGIDTYPWTYPYVDVFPLANIDGKITYTYAGWQKKYPGDYYWPSEIASPLPLMPFGPLTIPVVHNAVNYLVRMYGSDWNDVAYVQYDHQEQHGLKRVKVKLINRSPPSYILPSQ